MIRGSNVENFRAERPVGEKEEEGRPFYPNHFLKEVIAAYLVIGILLTLAVLHPFPLHEKANPFRTPEGIKPEWYLMYTYQFLKYVPKVIGLLSMGFFAVLLFLLPFLDRSPHRRPRRRKLTVSLGTAVLLLALVLGILGFLSEGTHTIFGKKYRFDLRGIPHPVTEQAEGQ
jgi:quinol-cytochrome oxidoreductase complex cytochrome b subunit